MSTDVGIIVGRFQVPYLHEGHRQMIQSVIDKHKQVAIFLGVNSIRSTSRNPLDYNTRYHMIQSTFANIGLTINSIKDMKSDVDWSNQLDEKIEELFPGRSATLYGSRDSFIKHYQGKHTPVKMESEIFISGTEIRNEVKNSILADEAFRAGIIYGTNDRYLNPQPTVDLAVINDNDGTILLGRKKNENGYRLIGGFVDVNDLSLEDAALRELCEESGGNMEVDRNLTYVCSRQVDDWRYRSEPTKILTTCFITKYLWGYPQPNDDIAELKWFKLDEVLHKDMVDEHYELFEAVKAKYEGVSESKPILCEIYKNQTREIDLDNDIPVGQEK